MDVSLSVIPVFWFPSKSLSARQAKARRFTGRSDPIILSRKIAGKLYRGITLTSYDNVVVPCLQIKRKGDQERKTEKKIEN
jgi:hypothetical protein